MNLLLLVPVEAVQAPVKIESDIGEMAWTLFCAFLLWKLGWVMLNLCGMADIFKYKGKEHRR